MTYANLPRVTRRAMAETTDGLSIEASGRTYAAALERAVARLMRHVGGPVTIRRAHVWRATWCGAGATLTIRNGCRSDRTPDARHIASVWGRLGVPMEVQ